MRRCDREGEEDVRLAHRFETACIVRDEHLNLCPSFGRLWPAHSQHWRYGN